MALAFLFVVLVGPLIELVVAIKVASYFGILNTGLLIVILSIAGLLLLRVEGLAAAKQIRSDLNSGKSPGRGLVSGALRMSGAALLVTPGLVTGIIGILLLIAPVRALLVPVTMGWLARRATSAASKWQVNRVVLNTNTAGFRRHPGQNDPGVVAGEFIDADGWEIEDRTPLPPSEGSPPVDPTNSDPTNPNQ